MTDHTMVIPLDGDAWSCKGYLDEEWLLRRAVEPGTGDVHGWIPARVPGSVLDDVVRAGVAPDPKFDMNSLACEWVPARSWVYRRQLKVDLDGQPAYLEFDGIDHDARVFVNGQWVGEHVGAFTVARLDVTRALRPGTNLLAVVIAPAPDTQSHFGRSDLVRVLKSRMTYGWDFCPWLPHLGIWDHARLVCPAATTVDELVVRPHVRAEAHEATVAWRATLGTPGAGEAELVMSLRHAGEVVASERVAGVGVGDADGTRTIDGRLEVPDPQLWWPNGYGGQPLYELEATLTTEDGQSTTSVRTALRSVTLAPDAGAPAARPYTFVVNGERVLIQGWNWVPMDVHHGVQDDDRLDHLLGLAARAGVNLLRVWGGGLIETDAFYDRCDRLGMMVWQEFPLSSSLHGSIPFDEPRYVEQVAQDARAVVARRRNHPSLVLWCGGNELDGVDGRPAVGDHPLLVALEKVVAELDPDRPWLPTSPTGPTASFTLAAVEADPEALHDVHGPWEHHGLVGQHQLYARASSLLHSEFGVEGMANLATIEAYVTPGHRLPADRSNPQMVHRGDFWINTPLIEEIFGPFDDLRGLVRASQLLQADGLRAAIEANRRRQWRSSGSIPWQLNEPFPNVFCTSAIDHAGRPKAAYHAVARAYADVAVSLALPTQAWAGFDQVRFHVWASSLRRTLRGARFEVSMRDPTGRAMEEVTLGADVTGESSSLVAPVSWPVPDVPLFWLDARLRDASGNEVHRTWWPCTTGSNLRPLRDLPPARFELTRPSDDRLVVRNVGSHVALGVSVHDARPIAAPGHLWSDGGDLTLFPGEETIVGLGLVGPVGDERPMLVDAWNTEPIVVD